MAHKSYAMSSFGGRGRKTAPESAGSVYAINNELSETVDFL